MKTHNSDIIRKSFPARRVLTDSVLVLLTVGLAATVATRSNPDQAIIRQQPSTLAASANETLALHGSISGVLSPSSSTLNGLPAATGAIATSPLDLDLKHLLNDLHKAARTASVKKFGPGAVWDYFARLGSPRNEGQAVDATEVDSFDSNFWGSSLHLSLAPASELRFQGARSASSAAANAAIAAWSAQLMADLNRTESTSNSSRSDAPLVPIYVDAGGTLDLGYSSGSMTLTNMTSSGSSLTAGTTLLNTGAGANISPILTVNSGTIAMAATSTVIPLSPAFNFAGLTTGSVTMATAGTISAGTINIASPIYSSANFTPSSPIQHVAPAPTRTSLAVAAPAAAAPQTVTTAIAPPAAPTYPVRIYVGNDNETSSQVHLYDSNGAIVTQDTQGHPVPNPFVSTGLNAPEGMVVIGGTLYVSNANSNTIKGYNFVTGVADPTFTTITGLNSPESMMGYAPAGLTRLFVADFNNLRVSEYTTTGTLLNANYFSVPNGPFGLATSSDGSKVFVSDYAQQTIEEFNGYTGAAINRTFMTDPNPNAAFAGIAVVGNTLYAANLAAGNNGTVETFNVTTGALMNANFITTTGSPDSISILGSIIYITDDVRNVVGEYNLSDGSPISVNFISLTDATGLAVIPEPGSEALAGFGLSTLLGLVRLRGRRVARGS